jgi:hypothetical protein
MKCSGCAHHEFCQKAGYAMRRIVRKLVREQGVAAIYTMLKNSDIEYIDKNNLQVIIEEN